MPSPTLPAPAPVVTPPHADGPRLVTVARLKELLRPEEVRYRRGVTEWTLPEPGLRKGQPARRMMVGLRLTHADFVVRYRGERLWGFMITGWGNYWCQYDRHSLDLGGDFADGDSALEIVGWRDG